AEQVRDHQALYRQTAHMVLSPRVKAFDLAAEPAKVRDAYGRSSFGQGCLMARRLVEAGVTFVEVQSTGWDTHGSELATLKKLIPPVDQGMAALVADLKSRGLLENTLVIWMGEFGRMPQLNLTAGRDHFPSAFNLALAGTPATDSRCSYIARLPCRSDPTRRRVVRRGKKRAYGRWATGPRRLAAERWLPRRASLGH